MSKVKCSVCSNELSGFCSIKKIGVKVNKPRTCEAFIYNKNKVKVHVQIPTIKFGYTEQQEAKKNMKKELAEVKAAIKEQVKAPNFSPASFKNTVPTNQKHPLTGDLSRFITSAKRGE